jgi:hypothetical protein
VLALHVVVADPARDQIVIGAAEEQVFTGVTADAVVAAQSLDRVAAPETNDHVGSVRSLEGVVTRGAGERRGFTEAFGPGLCRKRHRQGAETE